MKFMHTFTERLFQAVQKKKKEFIVETAEIEAAEMVAFKGLVATGWDFGWEEAPGGLIILPKLGHWCDNV